MQAANPPPPSQSAAVACSSTRSSSSADAIPHSSRRERETASIHPAIRFVANHHRQHNPHDPKLRAKPSFKSRRSSLFGAMLKSKDDHHRKLGESSWTPSPPLAPILTRPQASSAISHKHTHSLPMAAPSTSHQCIRTLQTDDNASSNHAEQMKRHGDTRPAISSPCQQSQSSSRTHHPSQTEAERRCLHYGRSSPPNTLLPSPIELVQLSSSTCSSANAKSIHFAAISGHPSPPSMHAAFEPAQTRLQDGAHSPDLTSSPFTPVSATTTAQSTPDHLLDASTNSQSPLEMQAQSSAHPPSSSSAREVLPLHLAPPCSPDPSAIPTPIISPCIVTDATNHSGATHMLNQPDDSTSIPLPEVAPTQPSPLPPIKVSHASALQDNLVDSELPPSTSATSAQRFSSLGRRSPARLTLLPDLPDPRSLPRTAARDITDELDSPTSPEQVQARAERCMSMLNFLVADSTAASSLQLAQASLSAEHLPRSTPAAQRPPASIPLVQASRQLRLEAAAAHAKTLQPSKVDLCEHVNVSVEPILDRLTMFGSMQSSSNYSLAGTVVVQVPKLNLPRLSAAAAAAAALPPHGTTADRPTVHVEALTVRFIGYSLYVDATGRFNAIKLAELSQELLQPQGFSCPVELLQTSTEERATSPTDDPATKAAQCHINKQSLKYETEFDLSIPGWLPASQRSRFGATFYCLQATAIVEGQAIPFAFSAFNALGSDSGSSHPLAVHLARSLQSELVEPAISKNTLERKSSRSKSKNTWLNKTAKQLQLRTSRKSTGPDADQARSHSSSCRPSASASKETASPLPGESDPLFTKTSEASNQLLPNGKHSIKSACLAILVRRCRDVVPVPVARLARLATASQVLRADGLPPSLSQSILALARLQEMPDALTSSPSAATNRPHISASASAPVSLASLATQRQAQVGHAAPTSVAQPSAQSGSLSPNASASEALNSTDVAAAASALPALAPSPRIDAYPTNWGQAEPAEPNVIIPPAPSAFDAPRDPAKLAAAAKSLTPSATLPNLPSSMSRASSLFDSRFGNANSPPRTSSRSASLGRSSAPLRHFVHRPTLKLPPELGVTPDKDAAGGLNFSLTLSLPSHVHVAGPKSDVLSFGIQIEVGRTEGWDALRKWGGLRLKDMELVCLQTERHSSMPSRSFCATFPLPPPPNRVDAADLPVVTSTRKTPVASDDAQAAAAEMRLRQSYDRSLILSHISLANQGKAPHPVEHNVERIRTTIVGPPPFPLGKPGEEANKQDSDKARKGKTRVNINNSLARGSSGFARSPTRDSPAGSGSHTPDGTSQSAGISSLRAAFAPTAPVNSSSRASVMQPLPRALAPCNNSSNSSLRQAFQGSDGSNRIQRAPRANTAAALSGFSSSPNAPSRSRRPIPFDIGVRETTVTAGLSNTVDASGADAVESDETPTNFSSQVGSQQLRVPARSNSDEDNSLDRWDRPESSSRDRETAAASSLSSLSATRMGVSSSVTATRSANRPAPRRSRFETAISRLSTFASSMLEQPMEPSTSTTHGSSQDVRAALSAGSSASNGAATASLRATYAFAGDDGQGVDLTKGRVRMTINLPLVPSDVDAARKTGSAQLMPDFESPYVRVRHKLKVKLGFGMKSNVATAQEGEEWAQALVMCVPVRFTEAPPKEVQEQFGPVSLVPDGGRSAAPGEAIAADQVRGAVASAAAASDATDSQQSSALPATFAEPLLPAYAQLFRDDGSRLADEGEDLPRYPGRMSVVGEIDEDPSSDAAAAAEAVQRAEPACSNLQTSKALGTVDEDQARESNSSWTEAPVYSAASNNEFMHRSRPGSSRYETATLPRLPTLGRSPRGPTLMDRTTSLAGQRILTQTDSSGVFGLRTPPSHPTSPRQSQSATVSSFAEKESNAEGKARVGSSAFDPLPPRPGMRRRSATTALPVTSSRITPAEVLDEALVTSALEDEEERMDRMQPSHTLDSLGARSQRGGVEMMDGSGPDEEDDEQEMVGEMDDDDEEDLNMDAVDSRQAESNARHSSMGMRIHRSSTQQTARSEGEEDQEGDNVEISRAM